MKKRPKLIIEWNYDNRTPEEIAEALRPYLRNEQLNEILNDKLGQLEKRQTNKDISDSSE